MPALVGVTTTAVKVASAVCMPVPLTEICCVLLGTFRVLFVTVMPALRLPADCGVNCTDTLHARPTVKEVLERHWLVLPVGCEKFAVKAGFAENTSGWLPRLVTVAVFGLSELVDPSFVLAKERTLAETFTNTIRLFVQSGM